MKNDTMFVADVLEQMNRMWNNGDVSTVEEWFAPDFVRDEPPGLITNGPEGMAEYVLNLRTQYPDLIITFDENVFDGEKMVLHWRLRGTDLGQPAGSKVPPSGKKVDIKGVDIVHFKDGKAVVDHAYVDRLDLLQQLGHIPDLASL